MHLRMASTMLDLPQPFGPTMPRTSWSKCRTVRSTNDLKPTSSSFLIFMAGFLRLPAALGPDVVSLHIASREPPHLYPRRTFRTRPIVDAKLAKEHAGTPA